LSAIERTVDPLFATTEGPAEFEPLFEEVEPPFEESEALFALLLALLAGARGDAARSLHDAMQAIAKRTTTARALRMYRFIP
jgi:hypothetical protein